MSSLPLPPGIDADSDILVVIPVDPGKALTIIEYDAQADDWDQVAEKIVGGWPEVAESADGSAVDSAGACLWVNSSALTPGLNSRATDICGFDAYGPVILAACRQSSISGIRAEDAAGILSELPHPHWQVE